MTDRLDLPLRYRHMVETLLHKYVPDAEVWAYGSRVNGESHEGSDLDLVLRSSTLEPLGMRSQTSLRHSAHRTFPSLSKSATGQGFPRVSAMRRLGAILCCRKARRLHDIISHQRHPINLQHRLGAFSKGNQRYNWQSLVIFAARHCNLNSVAAATGTC